MPSIAFQAPWNVSLHGGHSMQYCEHASSLLRDMLDAAVDKGMALFGVTEHASRMEARYLYPSEIKMGWDIAKVQADFEAYAADSRAFVEEYAGRLTVLRGFEIEVVPVDSYAPYMRQLRERHGFDYMVGSVHYLGEHLFDMGPEELAQAVAQAGSLEAFAVAYYHSVADMLDALRPEVVGHLDVIRKYCARDAALDTPPIQKAVERALDAARAAGSILDINTGAYRRGFDAPFPAPWIVRMAHRMGVPVCFGDDSHSVADVGSGIPEARAYLLSLGVEHVTVLTREEGDIVKKQISLA